MFDDDEVAPDPAVRPTSGWVVTEPVEVLFMGSPKTLPAGSVLINGGHGQVLDWNCPVAGFDLPTSGVTGVIARRVQTLDGTNTWGVGATEIAEPAWSFTVTHARSAEEAFEAFAAFLKDAGWPFPAP